MFLAEDIRTANMCDSPYEDIMFRPRLGLTEEYAYVHHMTEWSDILKEEPNFSSFFFRLRDLKWDSLDQDFIYIGKYKFPVFFHVEPRYPETEEENFSNMLITTGFPLCPANKVGYIFPFREVERAVPLPWVGFDMTPLKPVYDLGYDHLLSGKILAMREKIDGYPLSQIRVGNEYYLVGRIWIPSVKAVLQAEVVLDRQEVHVVNPFISSSFELGGYKYLPHSPISYDYDTAQSYREGVMIFLDYCGVVREYRLKHNPSIEIEVKYENTCIGPLQVPDGIWEVTLSSFPYNTGHLVPLKQRPWKKVFATGHYAADLAIRSFYCLRVCHLPKTSHSQLLVREGTGSEWTISGSQCFRYNNWTYAKGIVTSSGLRVGDFMYSEVIDIGKGFLVSEKKRSVFSRKLIPLLLISPDGTVMVSSYPDKVLGTPYGLPWFSNKSEIYDYLDSLKITEKNLFACVYKGNLGYASVLSKRIKGKYLSLDFFLLSDRDCALYSKMERGYGYNFSYLKEELCPIDSFPYLPFITVKSSVISVIQSRLLLWLKTPMSLEDLRKISSKEQFKDDLLERALYLSPDIITKDGKFSLVR